MRIPVNKPSITQKEIDYVTDAVTNCWGDHCYDYINKFTGKLKELQFWHKNYKYIHPDESKLKKLPRLGKFFITRD